MAAMTVRPAPTSSERRPRGRPARSATVDTEALLKNARQVFAKRGFDATSVREIARDAGVDPALMAHYFGSKEALWGAVVGQIVEQTAPMIRATAQLRQSDLGSRRRVEQALVIFIDRVFSEPDISLFFSTAATEHGERLAFLIERLVRPYHDVFIPLLTDAMKSGELACDDPEVTYWMLLNAISKTVSYSHVLAAFSSLPGRPAAFKRTVLASVLNMLGPVPQSS
ncbi:TetR/AcrR family transcriptional regulator [Paraburkholderia sp. USG1]|uniref:TetR/AcrR family transcriptional regulator n=1 Tax=Paraburkholderia sp. USG1 TaxID=2952268 RepID=UPI002860510D|nr:helix-turn-helix domain-containing protein [Paraburkholderia sp. USG1]MDR8398364.1 TetR/AcrR family transcriptional regulator [Paraburkholderia sp. USG1]